MAETWPQGADATFGRNDLIPRDLDELSRLSYAELCQLYARLGVPRDLHELDGALCGRMLAFRGTGQGPVFDMLATLGRWKWFPWEGKTLTAESATEGAGVNRIRLPGMGLRELFPFVTRLEPSKVDGKPCVHIDYSSHDNPAIIRAVRDELRLVSQGLFLGPVFVKHGRSATLVTWFGLQCGAVR